MTKHWLDSPTFGRLYRGFAAAGLLSLAACSPEVGSDAWCKKMVDVPRADWSMNDATAFAQHCVFKEYDKQ